MTGELILYTTEDGSTRITLRAMDGTAWLTQLEIAELFATTKQNVSLHLRNIFEENELQETSVVKESLTTAADGKNYPTKLYNLDAILAIGYRISSPRGTQFRQWATTVLREYLVKGFAMNDERLKNPGGTDYFDALLERIRDIRASEKLFYQKVRDIYSRSVDYTPKSDQAQLFFKTVQNKMLYAVTRLTAAELVKNRSNAAQPNMGLTTWDGAAQGRPIRKSDVVTAKNYLQQEEMTALNRIVTMFLDLAEDTAMRRQTMQMKDWEQRLDEFLAFNERAVLSNAGSVSHAQAEQLAFERYAAFDHRRREEETIAAECEAAEEWQRLAAVEKQTMALKKRKKKA